MCSVPAGPEVPVPEAGALAGARDRSGLSPREWLAQALDPGSPIIELRRNRVDDQMLELHLGTTVLAHHSRLPLRTNGVSSAALDMCLPSVPGLDSLFSELRRVLRPTGTFAALVPARPICSRGQLRAWWPLHRALGGRPRFRNDSARDHLHWLVASADFAVLADDRRTFHLPIPGAAAATRAVNGLVLDGVWPPDLAPDRLDRACDTLAGFASPGRTLPIPLRLLVARR